MGISYNFICDKCGCKEYLEAENDYEKVLICKNCANGYVIEQKKFRPIPNTPHCPVCNSTEIEKISATSKVAGAVAFGLFSKKINKTFKCKNCGYTW